MQKISDYEINSLSEKATISSRKRVTHNYHTAPNDRLQRMLNALQPGTYVTPHMHENPDKREVFIILSGKIAVIEFSDNGEVSDFTILNKDDGIYGVEIAPRVWHSIIVLEENSVVYEVKDGPYSPIDDKNFAPWAPKEGDENCSKYLQTLKEKLNL